MPLNSKANSPRAIGGREENSENTMITMARAIISGPSPRFASSIDLLCSARIIPTAILSNPIIKRTIAAIRIIVCVVIPGYVKVMTIKIIAVAPKPSSRILSQLLNFLLSLLLLLSLFEGICSTKLHLQ